MKVYSISEGRKILGELVNQVKYLKKPIALGKHGKADVLLISLTDEDTIPIGEMASASESFAFLEQEPDLYSLNDLTKRYV